MTAPAKREGLAERGWSVDRDGVMLSGRTVGEGPPLLLINGYAATAADWDPAFLGALAMRRTVICPDNRGVGGSGPASGRLTIDSMAADLLAVLDRLEVRSAPVVGWSMGGFVAQQLAATAPERVEALALIATDPGGPDAVAADPEIWARLIDHSGTPREQATRLIGLLFPPPAAATIDERFGELVAEARSRLSAEALSAQEAAMAAWHAEPARTRLAAIEAPAFVACGTEDVVIPPANSVLLSELLEGSRVREFDGVGHAFMAQFPAALAAAIGEFLG